MAKQKKKKGGNKNTISSLRAMKSKGAVPLGQMYAEAKANMNAGRLYEAEQGFKAILSLVPNHTPSLIELAQMAIDAVRMPIALNYAKQAVAVDHAEPRAHFVLANVLANLGLVDLAESELIVAQQLDPQNAQVWNGLGLVYSQQGRFEEALDAFHRTIELSPNTILTYLSLASAKRFTPDDPDLALIKDLTKNEAALGMEDRAMIHFALAKAYQDCGDYDQAFAEYQQGNSFKLSTLNYDPDLQEAFNTRLIEVQSREWLERLQGAGSDMEGPIFIVGMPRSGTTLLEKLLCRHPLVSGLGEPPYIHNQARTCAQRLGRDEGLPGALDFLTPELCKVLGDEYVGLAHQFGVSTPYTVDKTPMNFLYLGFILAILPKARILHMFRHPLDTCLSIYQQLFAGPLSYAYDLEHVGRYYLQYRRLMDHWMQLFPDKILDVNYEDLVADSEGQLRHITEFCGLPWDDACLDDGGQHVTRTASIWQARQPIYKTSVRRWRKYEKHLGPLLEVLAPVLEDPRWREEG